MMKNEAAFLTQVRKIELLEIPMPILKADEVLLETEYVGVCGSDAHFFASGERKGKPFALPFILGHEYAGRVVSLGKGVRGLQVGERVTFEPQQTCGVCSFCRSGRYNLCAAVRFPSVPPHDGLIRRFAALPSHLLYRLPENISSVEGAMIEPLAVGLAAAERGDVTIGKTVVILGAGCIGLMTLLACRARGASRVIMVDLLENRLAEAARIGADETVCAQERDVAAEISRLTNGAGAEIVIETAGSPVTASMTERLLARGGVVVLVGNVSGETPYAFMNLMYKEGEIRTIYRYHNHFETAIRAVAAGQIPLSKIRPRMFAFEETQQAFQCALEDRESLTKAMIAF